VDRVGRRRECRRAPRHHLCPSLHDAFGTEALTLPQHLVVLLLSTTAFVAVEIEKVIRRRGSARGATTRDGPPASTA
jgi:hypothetical protein